jgi:hypothetical protein
MTTLGEELPIEIKRNQELKSVYDGLPGGVGSFGSMMIQNDIDAAIKALADGDVIEMMKVYEKLKNNE